LSCNPCLALKYRKDKTRIVNINDEEFDIYIGRGTKWGNKYHIGVDGTREEVIEKFKLWWNRHPELHNEAIRELQGKILGCHCKPLPCHGDIYVAFLEGEEWKPNLSFS
jgi:hypothetical protein